MIRKTFLTVLAFAAVASIAIAQQTDASSREEALREREAMAIEKLGLDDAQATQFKQANQVFMDKARDLRSSDMPQEEKRAALGDLNKARNEQMKTFMTDVQYGQYMEMQKEARQQMRERQGDGTGKGKKKGKKKDKATSTNDSDNE